MMVWAERSASRTSASGCRRAFRLSGNDGLYPSGYYLFQSRALRGLQARAEARAACHGGTDDTPAKTPDVTGPALWKGYLLPAIGRRYLAGRRAGAYHQVLRSSDMERL